MTFCYFTVHQFTSLQSSANTSETYSLPSTNENRSSVDTSLAESHSQNESLKRILTPPDNGDFKLEGFCVFIPPKLFDKYHVLLSTSASLHVICKWIYPSPQMYQDKKETRLARNSSTLGWSITSTVGSSTRVWLLHKN